MRRDCSGNQSNANNTAAQRLSSTIIKYTGAEVLKEAIDLLGDDIKAKNENLVGTLNELLQKKAKEIHTESVVK